MSDTAAESISADAARGNGVNILDVSLEEFKARMVRRPRTSVEASSLLGVFYAL